MLKYIFYGKAELDINGVMRCFSKVNGSPREKIKIDLSVRSCSNRPATVVNDKVKHADAFITTD